MLAIKKIDILILVITFFLFILSFVIIKSFVIPLLFTILLVYILNPIYKKLIKKLKNHALTSLIIISTFILLFVSPIVFTVITLSSDFSNFENPNFIKKLDNLNEKINNKYKINLDLKQQFKTAIDKVNKVFNSMLLKVPEFFFNIFIIIFFYYYFSKDYSLEVRYLKNIFRGKKIKYIQKKLEDLIEGLIYGQILVRFIQALLGTIGFLIFGINNALLWGVLLFFVAFIPIIGTGLIWGPLAIFALLKEEFTISLGIIIIGIIISSIDNILLPYFISEKTNIGPVLTLISIIGGLEFFGFYGIILGPFFLGLLLVLIDEILFEIRQINPKSKKFIWKTDERKKYKQLKTEEDKKKFIEKINEKYENKNTIEI